VGGLVLSAASDSFSLLIRALKAQGRVDVLSRPSLMLTDNQTGFFQVGQRFPLITGTNATLGVVQQSIEYADIGIVLRVTPRIGPDNSVLMRVEPQVSDAAPTNVAVAPGVFASAINTQTVETTVLAADGETVVLGGLIRRSDQKAENKIPVLGDLPWVGAAFRYRTQQQQRREVIFIMTPRVMRTPADMRRIFADEARKMSWAIKEAANVSGVNPDVLRGKLGDPYCNVDNIVGPAPNYLPISRSGFAAPFSNPATTVLPPSNPVQPLYPPTTGWPAGPGGVVGPAPDLYAPPPAFGNGSASATPAPAPAPQQYQPPANVPGVPATTPAQPTAPVNPAAFQQQQPVLPPQQPQQPPPAAPQQPWVK
jgi:hypothetical protein